MSAYSEALKLLSRRELTASEVHWTETDQDSAGNDVRVHRQEAILTAAQARDWRSGSE